MAAIAIVMGGGILLIACALVALAVLITRGGTQGTTIGVRLGRFTAWLIVAFMALQAVHQLALAVMVPLFMDDMPGLITLRSSLIHRNWQLILEGNSQLLISVLAALAFIYYVVLATQITKLLKLTSKESIFTTRVARTVEHLAVSFIILGVIYAFVDYVLIDLVIAVFHLQIQPPELHDTSPVLMEWGPLADIVMGSLLLSLPSMLRRGYQLQQEVDDLV